jgi:amyloid beta A4 protein
MHSNQVYPKKDIRNIVESNRYYRIDNWQTVFGRSSHHSKGNRQHYVKPIRCLEGSFQSDALLVPEHCLFDHIHNNSVCESTAYWNRTASHSCQGKGKILESYAMLLPCGVGIFSGVEFVCCPHPSADHAHSTAAVVSHVRQPQAYARNAPEVKELGDRSTELQDAEVEPPFGDSLPSPALKSRKNGKKLTSGVSTKIRLENEKYANEDANDEEDADDDGDDSSSDENGDEETAAEDAKGEDNVSSNRARLIKSGPTSNTETDSRRKSAKKLIKPTETDSNDDNDDDDFYDDEYEEKEDETAMNAALSSTTSSTTTTTTTETPLEHYYSHFDAKSEHQQFKMAEKALKDLQSKKMSKIIREYAQFQSRFGEKVKKGSKKATKKVNKTPIEAEPVADDGIRKTMEKRYENTLEGLESQNANEKQQLNAMHQQRVLTLINMKKQEATDCYTNALNQFPLRIKKIQKCLEKLMKSLEKDRVHTLHHYRHLLLVNPKLAAKEKQATLTHLENLIVIANRSISMLSKYPNVNEKIHNHIVAFWHNLRGVAFNQQVSRETEATIVDKYEREIVQAAQEKARRKAEQLQQAKRLQQQIERQPKPEVVAIKHHSEVTSSTQTPPIAVHRVGSVVETHVDSSTVKPTPHESLHAIETNEADSTEHERRLAKVEQTAESYAASASAMQRSVAHHEASYVLAEQKPEAHYLTQVRQTSNGSQATSAVITIAGAAVAVAIVAGIVLYRANASQSPLSQGFVAVQQHQSPMSASHSAEAQHVEALQVNGYENPTYKFFEGQTA